MTYWKGQIESPVRHTGVAVPSEVIQANRGATLAIVTEERPDLGGESPSFDVKLSPADVTIFDRALPNEIALFY